MGGGEPPPQIPPQPAPPKPDPKTCSICFEQFTRRKRVPISLVCGHTFCAACIRGHARARSDEGQGLIPRYSIECGVCRAMTFAHTSNLRKNVMLLEYMEEKGDLADSDGEGEDDGGERENVNTGQMVGENGENQSENDGNANPNNLGDQRFGGGGGGERNFLLELLRQFDLAERAIAGEGVGGGGPSPHRLQLLDQFRAEIADMRWDVDRQIQELFQFLMDRFFADDRFLFADKRQRMNAILEHINAICGQQQPLNSNAPGAPSFSGAPFVGNFNGPAPVQFLLPYPPMMLVLMTFGDFEQFTQMPPPPQSQHYYPPPRPPQWSSTGNPNFYPPEGQRGGFSSPQGTAGGLWQGRESAFDRGAPPPNVVPQNQSYQQQQYRWQRLSEQNPAENSSGTTFTAPSPNPPSSFTMWRESETNDDNDDQSPPPFCPQPSSNFSNSSSYSSTVGNNNADNIFGAGRGTRGNPLVPVTSSTRQISSGNPFGALNNTNNNGFTGDDGNNSNGKEEETGERRGAAGIHFRPPPSPFGGSEQQQQLGGGGGDFRYTSRGLGGEGLRRRPPPPTD